MIQRFAVLTLLAAAAIVLVPSAQAQQSQSYYASRGAAQASCPGAQVIRQKPPKGTMVMNDPGDGSTAYGAYTCARPAGAATNNMTGTNNMMGAGHVPGAGAATGLPGTHQN
ncbi:MAG TPA: hypothetical protein VL574_08985 [Stellaceae bacterium]|nr:hypothetical protein [Stellaceae bacterium]